jgi:uncharacterized protein with GYD domain
MSKFAVFFSYTPETWAKLIANPEDRSAALRTTVEEAGGTLEAVYYMFGREDGFVIVDMPDSAAAAAMSLVVNSTGALAHLETRELIPASDLAAVLDGAARIKGTYHPPGG